MSVTVELPDDALARLRAEAARRGTNIDEVIATLAAQLPGEQARTAGGLSFSGIGSSGTSEPIGRRHREIIAEHFADKTANEV